MGILPEQPMSGQLAEEVGEGRLMTQLDWNTAGEEGPWQCTAHCKWTSKPGGRVIGLRGTIFRIIKFKHI